MSAAGPEVSVVVASHRRPVRLRWLLNALEDQTLPPERWELVVCDDSGHAEIDRLLRGHPLARRGTMRVLRLPSGAAAARARNAGWRMARAPLVAFTGDDCRPASGWLEALARRGRRSPGAVLQGATRPDPEEEHLLHAAVHARSQRIDPPTLCGQVCNVAYPRELLERLGGFDERLSEPAADLALRARAAAAEWAAVPDAVVCHAVHTMSLPGAVANAWRRRELPATLSRHPELRRELQGRVLWRASHAWLPVAGAGLALARSRRSALPALLALPWAISALPPRGASLRGRARAMSELPGRLVLDAAEVTALAWGSIRHRTLLL